jgi:hypothetical protein
MKYLLEDRERNYYDDSDFYAIFYDTETESIRSEMYGTTRGPSPRVAPADEYIRPVPADIMEKARQIHFERVFDALKDRDRSEVDEPSNAEKGELLELLSDGKWKDKKNPDSDPIEWKAGEKATVIWIGAFGQFYRNGYNQPGRENRRVGLKFADGRKVFVGLNKCKLARSYLPDEQIEKIAWSFVDHGNFASLVM